MQDTQRAAPSLTDQDLFLFNEGTHHRLYQKLGAHLGVQDGKAGARFGVWAPDAERVSVVGDFNAWEPDRHPLRMRGGSGIWEGFLPGLKRGTRYKFHVASRFQGFRADKTDPFGLYQETAPKTASILWDLDYAWNDGAWMGSRGAKNGLAAPLSIYELHLGSWRCIPEEGNRPLTYRETAPQLIAHVKELGFTHVEFMPVMEHPFGGSWGYQTTGYFAPTSRFGTPQDFMYLVDQLHQNDIGVILDWVPSHFPTDGHGLGYFDGTHLYEHMDTRLGFHPDWKSNIFNYGRHEVRSFLLSSALFWLDKYHIDGLRVDAVASMLYLDYSRREGEWIPNRHGGRENLEAIGFLRQLNEAVYTAHPDVHTFAEESTAWPMVSRPTYVGGLGFGLKWDMGWMHDMLAHMAREPVHRKWHHDEITFRMMYAFSENFVLPLSHDEVVHGKRSLLEKMPGDDWQKFANLRLLYACMFGQPAKKLLFMGGEFGQRREWSHEGSLDWHLLREPAHAGLQRWLGDLNRLYRSDPAMHELDVQPGGFEWIQCHDAEQGVLAFLRRGRSGPPMLVACNFTPVAREGYRLGVPLEGRWEERLNSDAREYGGGGVGNGGGVRAEPVPAQDRPWSLRLSIPPLGAVFLKGPDRR